MASAREIRRRIRSIKNTAQITRAMQMVASSKMRRAQDNVLGARPYADELKKLVARLASQPMDEKQPLMSVRPLRKLGVILVTPDRGLCGALPGNVNRRAGQLVVDEQKQNSQITASFITVGKKGREFAVRTQQHVIGEFTEIGDHPEPQVARSIARVAIDAYLAEELDAVYLVYTRFISTLTQQPQAVQILPVQPPEDVQSSRQEYIYEPDASTILGAILPRYVEIQVHQSILESIASEYSAKMVAMKNATDNANDLLSDLTITYNKARQQSITTQILEVVAGAGNF